jgi:prepilin-type N-terminal cleavage/methylation domain-containing protein
MKHSQTPEPQSRGFSLVELLVVVGVIAIMAAVSLPMISGYLRHYKIRGGAQEVAAEIQSARGKAIGKNVNWGVVFVTLDAETYRWVIEDDQNPNDGMETTRPTLATVMADARQAGPVLSLPLGVQFSQACTTGMPGGTTWDVGMRFNRLGAWCDPNASAANCPALTGVGTAFVKSTGAGAAICLMQSTTGLSKVVTITNGGRVVIQP